MVETQARPGGPDYRNRSVEGLRFRGDLAGADFSGARIRGADFRGADLTGADFTGARGGKRHRIFGGFHAAFFLAWSLAIGFSLGLAALMGAELIEILARSVPGVSDSSVRFRWLFATVWGSVFLVVAVDFVRGRFGLRTAGTALAAAAVMSVATAFVLAGAAARSLAPVLSLSVPAAVAYAGTVAAAMAAVLAGALAGIVVAALVVSAVAAVAVAAAVSASDAGPVAVATAIGGAGAAAATVAIFAIAHAGVPGAVQSGAGVLLAAAGLLSAHVATQTYREAPGFLALRRIGLRLACMGGTDFRGANLTGADFSGANLKECRFGAGPDGDRTPHLFRTRFRHAEGLHFAWPGDTLLAQPRVRDLLVAGAGGESADLGALDLRGADLEGLDLSRADFTETDLGGADLRNADLRHANLEKVRADGADFRGADLAGACLDSWTLDAGTRLEGIRGDFVFLKRGGQRRIPRDPGERFPEGGLEKFLEAYRKAVAEAAGRDGVVGSAVISIDAFGWNTEDGEAIRISEDSQPADAAPGT